MNRTWVSVEPINKGLSREYFFYCFHVWLSLWGSWNVQNSFFFHSKSLDSSNEQSDVSDKNQVFASLLVLFVAQKLYCDNASTSGVVNVQNFLNCAVVCFEFDGSEELYFCVLMNQKLGIEFWESRNRTNEFGGVESRE